MIIPPDITAYDCCGYSIHPLLAVCDKLHSYEEFSNALFTIEAAGASMVVLEGIPAKLAEMITATLQIPTIGIGAGVGCDGQVLVYQDMLGMFSDFNPKFVKVFADTGY